MTVTMLLNLALAIVNGALVGLNVGHQNYPAAGAGVVVAAFCFYAALLDLHAMRRAEHA